MTRFWNHWSAEKITAVQQRKALTVQSFVLFGIIKDTWIISDNPLLGGAEFEAYEGWVGKTNFNTYRQKLLPLMSQLSSYNITKLQTGKLQQQQMVKSMAQLN